MQTVSAIVSYLNANQPVVVALAGLFAVAVQYALNHFKALGTLSNYILGLVALPGVATIALAFSTNVHLAAYPWVAVVGQLLYASYEQLKKNAVNSALKVSTPTVLGEGV